MNCAALLLRQVTDYIRVQAEARLQQAREGELGLSYEPLAGAPDFLKKEVLHLWLGEFIPGARDIGASHLEELAELEHKPVGSRISLPGRWEIRRTYTGVVAESQPAAPGKTASTSAGKSDFSSEVADASKPEFWTLNREELEEKGQVETTIFGKKIRFCLFFYKDQEEIPRNSYTKWLDYGKIKDNIVIRCRKNGDYLTIRTDGSRQKLQDYMVNQKIPRELRDEVLLLCEGQHVIWVLDYRISEYYKIEQSTKQVLEVQILEEREHE
jgi:tRNA(Ile)-lysidine synthase